MYMKIAKMRMGLNAKVSCGTFTRMTKCQTLSKAFSIKKDAVWISPMFKLFQLKILMLKICSVMFLSGLNRVSSLSISWMTSV